MAQQRSIDTRLPQEYFSWKILDLIVPVKRQLGEKNCFALQTAECVTYAFRLQHWLTNNPNILSDSASAQELLDFYPGFDIPDHCNPLSAIPWVEEVGITVERDHPYLDLNEGRSKKTRDEIRMYPRIMVDEYTINWDAPWEEAKEMIRMKGLILGRIVTFEGLKNGKNKREEEIFAQDVPKSVIPEKGDPLTHSLILTGYGVWNGHRYYEVKNCCREEWGCNGYGRISFTLVKTEAPIDSTRYIESEPQGYRADTKQKKKVEESQATTEKKKAPEKEKDSEDKEVSVSLLKIQIGLIRKAWQHPSAASFLVEEIDVGEAKSKLVVSGLANSCAPEELTNRRVVLITNVEPVNVQAMVSEGLVLWASKTIQLWSISLPQVMLNLGNMLRFLDMMANQKTY